MNKLVAANVCSYIAVLLIMVQQAHTIASGNLTQIELPLSVDREQVVYSWYTDRCADQDTPDTPPRAFRDFAGDVHLFSTHEANRALVGPDFGNLHHACTVVYRGAHSD